MKKLIGIVILSLMIYHPGNAQFVKGNLMMGTTIGTFGYSNSNSNYSYDAGNSRVTNGKNYTISAGPQVGIFVTNHLVLGVTPSVSFTKNRSSINSNSVTDMQAVSKTNTTTTTVNFGPYLRDYFATLNPDNLLYLQVNGAVGTGKGSSSGSSYSVTNSTNSNGKISGIFNWNVGGSVGLTHLFYRRIGMDVAIGYLYNHQHQMDASTSSTVTKSTGITAENTSNYTLNTATHGVSFGAGMHWFLRG